MAEWRWFRGWSEEELAGRLRRVDPGQRSFEGGGGRLVPARGWNHVRSDAVVGCEPPGEPRGDGAFEHARALLPRFAFSDPRIVVAHFDPAAPLRGRVVLLELQALGIHFLSPVVVAGVEEAREPERTVFAFAIETLPGHLEHGRERFRIEKEHATGAVRFRIEAAWRPGAFPGLWARAGFALLGRRYQLAWHRLAHVRLRRLLAEGAPPARGALEREGPPLAAGPILFYAQRALGRRGTHVEQEGEALRLDRLGLAGGLAALCGARTLAPIAALAVALRRERRSGTASGTRVARALGARGVAPALAAPAAAELAADKLPAIPSRLSPPALAGRAGAGALVAGVIAGRGGERRRLLPVVGALAAVGGALLSARLRGRAARRLPGPAAGALEDVLVVAAAAALARRALADVTSLAPGAA